MRPTTTELPTEGAVTAGTAARSGPDLRRLPRGWLVVAGLAPLLLAALLGLALLARITPPSATAVGAQAPDVTLVDLDGRTVSLASLEGRPVILNFWASWCGPCIEEFPLLRDAADRHAADGLAVVGVVYRDRSEAARAFMDRHGGTWPAAMDPGERVATAYGILAPPDTFFIARDGTIAGRHVGQISPAALDAKLALIVEDAP